MSFWKNAFVFASGAIVGAGALTAVYRLSSIQAPEEKRHPVQCRGRKCEGWCAYRWERTGAIDWQRL